MTVDLSKIHLNTDFDMPQQVKEIEFTTSVIEPGTYLVAKASNVVIPLEEGIRIVDLRCPDLWSNTISNVGHLEIKTSAFTTSEVTVYIYTFSMDGDFGVVLSVQADGYFTVTKPFSASGKITLWRAPWSTQ